MKLDDVHRAHGQARTVDHATDVAVQLDVVETVLPGLDLGRVFLGQIPQLADLGMAVKRIVVEAHLGIEGQHPAVFRFDQRVDLHQRGVGARERSVQRGHELHRRGAELARDPEIERDPPADPRRETDAGIHGELDDRFGPLRRDLFDLGAAFPAGDEHGRFDRPIQQDRQVKLPGDLDSLGHHQLAHLAPFGACLPGDQNVAEHPAGQLLDSARGSQHDAPERSIRIRAEDRLTAGFVAEGALAAAAGVDLGLDHDRLAESPGQSRGRLGSVGHASARHGYAVLLQQRPGLILMDVQRKPYRVEEREL